MTTCPTCSLPLPDTAVFCARCGSPVTPAPPAAPATLTMSAPPLAAAGASRELLAPVASGPSTPAGSAPRPAGSKTGLIIGVAVASVLLLVGVGVGGALLLAHRTADALASAASSVSPADQPTSDSSGQDSSGQDTSTGQDPNASPSDDQSSSGDMTEDPEATAISQSPTDPWGIPSDGKVCSVLGTGGYATAATGNDHTSCPFAIAVRDAYIASQADGAPTTLTVTSPVTHQTYDMTCGQVDPVTCTGGVDAVVLVGNSTTPIPQ